jgi:dolichol-phosphate mannosyltransferase
MPEFSQAKGPYPMDPVYSFVLPIFNEEAVLPALFDRLEAVLESLDGPSEVIFVDDGSTDASVALLTQRVSEDSRFRYIGLSRNFGQQIAMTAGLDAASGEAIILMDGDLQDPPELIFQMVEKWREGFDIVYAQRKSRAGESRFKLMTASLFYKMMSKLAAIDLPQNVGDFRLIDRKALDAFRSMREQDRFVRGMFTWVGFRQTAIEFERAERAAGETKWPVGKLVKLAVSGLVSFSDAPLRLALWLGLLVSTTAIIYGLYVFVERLLSQQYVAGWASTMFVVAFLGGANMMLTGIMGLYVGRIYSEVKRRPLYIVARSRGFERVRPAAAEAPAINQVIPMRGAL